MSITMTKQDYRNTITSHVSADEAFNKIARVSEWWATDITGDTCELGDKFTVRWGETFVDFKIIEAIPGQKVVWSVTNCNLPWLKDKTEWNGTNIIFEISSRNEVTNITMTHEGLVPKIECYGDCEEGWNKYFGNSLAQFLTEGKGLPN